MIRLAIHATIALLAVAVAGAVAVLGAAPAVVAVLGVLTLAAAYLRGQDAALTLFNRLPVKTRREIVTYGVLSLMIIESLQITLVTAPVWLHAVFGAFVALLWLLGIRNGATSTIDPRNDDGVPLVPAPLTGGANFQVGDDGVARPVRGTAGGPGRKVADAVEDERPARSRTAPADAST